MARTEIARADQERMVQELKEKIASGNYVKESKWAYDPWYGNGITDRLDTESLWLLEERLADNSRWMLIDELHGR